MKSYLFSNNSSATSTSAARYNTLVANGSFAGNASANNVYNLIPHDLTLRNFRARLENSPGTGKGYIFTITKNGVDTDITFTISDTNYEGSDTTHSVNFSAGDKLNYKVEPFGTPAASGIVWTSIEQEATDLTAIIGVNAANITTSTLYLPIMGNASPNFSPNNSRSIVPTNGTIKNLRIEVTVAPDTGTTRTFTLYKNGSATALTVTIDDTQVTNVDNSNSVSVSAGDYLALQCAVTGSPSNVVLRSWSMSFDPDIDGESFISHCTWSTASLGTSNDPAYQIPTGFGGGWQPDDVNQYFLFDTLIAKALYVTIGTAPGSGKSRVFTLRNSGVNNSVTATISDTNTSANITGEAEAYTTGDNFSLEQDASGTPSAAGFISTGILFEVTDSGTIVSSDINFEAIGTDSTLSDREFELMGQQHSGDNILFELSGGGNVYTKESLALLPTDDTNLSTFFTTQEKIDVESDDNAYVDLESTSTFSVMLFKVAAVDVDVNTLIVWKGKSSLAPSLSTVYLQVYNFDTLSWETIDSDNITAANTKFELSYSLTGDTTPYFNTNDYIIFRVYQET